MKKRLRTQKCFTFIEVMLVAAMLSVIALALGGVLNNGIDIWRRVNGIAMEGEVAIFFDKFTTDVKNAIVYKGIDFSGDEAAV